ncbi:MAG TPA: CopG family transcriptional regulator [Clostridiales bacterium]|nr:CopG family transcriptional regulator [Clostridiales bacterium]
MSRTKRINISLPEDMLKEIDAAVENAKTGRSRFFRQAVRYYLTKGTVQDIRGQMAKGYGEMGAINLDIAESWLQADNDQAERSELHLREMEME